MTRFDRLRLGRHAGDHAVTPRREVEPPAAGVAADRPLTLPGEAGTFVAAAEIPPAASFDAPYAHARSAVVPARAVGRIRWDESIAAITGFGMLAGALSELSLETQTRGYFMWVYPPDDDGQKGLYEVAVLGHPPGNPDRLWWLIVVDKVSPPEVGGPPMVSELRPIGPIDEIAAVADYLARALHIKAERGRFGRSR